MSCDRSRHESAHRRAVSSDTAVRNADSAPTLAGYDAGSTSSYPLDEG